MVGRFGSVRSFGTLRSLISATVTVTDEIARTPLTYCSGVLSCRAFLLSFGWWINVLIAKVVGFDWLICFMSLRKLFGVVCFFFIDGPLSLETYCWYLIDLRFAFSVIPCLKMIYAILKLSLQPELMNIEFYCSWLKKFSNHLFLIESQFFINLTHAFLFPVTS